MKLPHSLALAAAICSAPALAQDKPVERLDITNPNAPAAPAETYPSFTFTLTPSGEYSFAGDLKNTTGDVSVARAGVDFTLNFAATQQLRFRLNTNVEGSWYDFKNAGAIIPGTADPISNAYFVRLSPSVMYHFSHQWSVIGGALLEISGEPDADLGDSFTGGGFVGARYAFSEQFSLLLGVAVKSSLEDDAYVFPLIGIEWQITPEVSFATAGLGARLTAKVSDQWAFFLQAGYQIREYRLADDNTLPDGVLRDFRFPVAIGATWSPTPNIDLSVRAGVNAWQEYEVDNSAGNQVSEINTKPTPFIGLSADFRF